MSPALCNSKALNSSLISLLTSTVFPLLFKATKKTLKNSFWRRKETKTFLQKVKTQCNTSQYITDSQVRKPVITETRLTIDSAAWLHEEKKKPGKMKFDCEIIKKKDGKGHRMMGRRAKKISWNKVTAVIRRYWTRYRAAVAAWLKWQMATCTI